MAKVSSLVWGTVFGIAVLVLVFAALDRTASGHDLYGTEAAGHFLITAACGFLAGGGLALILWTRKRQGLPSGPDRSRRGNYS
jgi:hypothetical protein